MIVVDTSAMLCVLLRQPGWEAYDAAIRAQPAILAGLAQGETVEGLEQALGPQARAVYNAYVAEAGIELQRFSKKAAAACANAWQRYGNGAMPGGLTLAQAMSFALARTLKAPLLYCGTIYDHTPARRVEVAAG
ncbi:type II toxin-antitoxin system VapC family toxin [Erythrobacter donghaensis]|jgi:ribonuclease VapC|uniref:type II toxin-antitoxin system VapC family toxin n=1 Tax=Erythrobacter donghaensis TaxID=267135 RepID=UPI00093B1D31|nr:type II toxin-antitoxin system VapC family toxin [Erythrobacter donghaensis]